MYFLKWNCNFKQEKQILHQMKNLFFFKLSNIDTRHVNSRYNSSLQSLTLRNVRSCFQLQNHFKCSPYVYCIAVFCELLLRISPTPPNNIQPCHCSKNFVTVQNKNFEKWLIPLLDFTSLRKMKILRVFSQQLGFHSYPERWWCQSAHLSASARNKRLSMTMRVLATSYDDDFILN